MARPAGHGGGPARPPAHLGSLAGLAVDPAVHLRAERLAGSGEVGERAIRRPQVRVRRHQVGLRDPDGRFRAAVGLGVEGRAGEDGRAIVAAGGHHLGMPHGHPRDPVDRDGPLVVREQVRGHATDDPEGGIEAGEQAAHRAVPGGDDDPEAGPREPGAEQKRGPAVDVGALGPVELEPHAGLRGPGPIGAPSAGAPGGLGGADGPAGGALVTLEAQGAEALVDDVGADAAQGALHELLDLVPVRVDHHGPSVPHGRVAPGVADDDVPGDGLGVAAGETGRRVRGVGEVERLEDLHDLPVRLRHGPSRCGWCLGLEDQERGPPEGPRDGGVRVRRRGGLVSVSAESHVRLRGRFPCPLSTGALRSATAVVREILESV